MIELFRPANGSEGEAFWSTWCWNCKREDGVMCAIQERSLELGKDDPDYPTEWQVIDGIPTCTAFERIA